MVRLQSILGCDLGHIIIEIHLPLWMTSSIAHRMLSGWVSLFLLFLSPLAYAQPLQPQGGDWRPAEFRFHTGETHNDLCLHYYTLVDRTKPAVLLLHGTNQPVSALHADRIHQTRSGLEKRRLSDSAISIADCQYHVQHRDNGRHPSLNQWSRNHDVCQVLSHCAG